MRRIIYGSGAMITTNDVATSTIRLSVALATMRVTDAVSIPIITGPESQTGTADLIIGIGIPLMVEPAQWHGEEPDFSTGATLLQMHSDYPHQRPTVAFTTDFDIAETTSWDPDLDEF